MKLKLGMVYIEKVNQYLNIVLRWLYFILKVFKSMNSALEDYKNV